MKLIEIFLLLTSMKQIYLIPDYCTSRAEPSEPNDCVFLSTENQKCCFNPNDKTRCFLKSGTSDDNLLCNIDYFYGDNYMMGKENYKEYKDKNGYCTFVYGNISGAFKYEGINKDVRNINEINGLKIDCLNNLKMIQLSLFTFILLLVLLF